MDTKPKLLKLSALIQQRNLIDREIGCLIERPALLAHAGEFITEAVFDIKAGKLDSLHPVDGVFSTGPLAGKNVSVKWYREQTGVLDIHPTLLPDYYLVLTGPRPKDEDCRSHPWVINMVYLFETVPLIRRLKVHKLAVGVATPLPQMWWYEAEIYPHQNSPLLKLNITQILLLKLFGQEDFPGPSVPKELRDKREQRPYA